MDETDYIRELEKYTNPTVLFLDDFLKGEPTVADRKYIYKVINTRYLKGMPMIISTEKSIKEILEFDEAIGSRLIEQTKGNIIEFPRDFSNNYRLKNIIQRPNKPLERGIIMANKVTDLEKCKIKELYEKGYSILRIANEIGRRDGLSLIHI